MLRCPSDSPLLTGNLTALTAEGRSPVKPTQHRAQGASPRCSCPDAGAGAWCTSARLPHCTLRSTMNRENSSLSYCFTQCPAHSRVQSECVLTAGRKPPLHPGHIILGEAHSGGRLTRHVVRSAALFLYHSGAVERIIFQKKHKPQPCPFTSLLIIT